MRALRVVGLLVLVLVVASLVALAWMDEPIRRWAEARINERLDGYSLRIGDLDLQPWRLGADVEDVRLMQEAHPEPPIVDVASSRVGIDWRALLAGEIVARVAVVAPALHVDLRQLREEARDETPVAERGWQAAVRSVLPIEINTLEVTGGSLELRDAEGSEPVRVDEIEARVENVRNVRSAEGEHPSPVSLHARVLDTGTLRVDGEMDFLAEPRPTGRVDFELEGVALERAQPAAERLDLRLRDGTLSTSGELRVGRADASVEVVNLEVDGLDADYVMRSDAPAPAEDLAREAAEEATTPGSGVRVHVREARVSGSTFGVVNANEDPSYRIFASITELTVEDFGNVPEEGETRIHLLGALMSSGSLTVDGLLRPERDLPDLDLAVVVEDLDLRTLNEALRAHAGFDVAGGSLSIYSQVDVKEGQVSGYVKPLFHGMDVYDREQDREEALTSQLYEAVVGGLSAVFENEEREEVATVTPIEGTVRNVEADAWITVVRLVKNAFVEAILPGLEQARAQAPS